MWIKFKKSISCQVKFSPVSKTKSYGGYTWKCDDHSFILEWINTFYVVFWSSITLLHVIKLKLLRGFLKCNSSKCYRACVCTVQKVSEEKKKRNVELKCWKKNRTLISQQKILATFTSMNMLENFKNFTHLLSLC